jgi:ornithine carbamoyltransferase
VLASIIEAAALLHFDVVAACPKAIIPIRRHVDRARRGAVRRVVARSAEAVEGADVVVTDTWISMGQAHAEEKLAAMMPYQVTEALMGWPSRRGKFLHCLPAHRGEEVVDAVIDGPQSLIWDEAENRLHAQKSVLRWCFGQIG